MDESRYKGGGTPGGKWGCAMSALFGLPVFFLTVLISSLGDCAPDIPCHKASLPLALLLTLVVALPIGLAVRWLVNRKYGER